jgi:hypothetical protein
MITAAESAAPPRLALIWPTQVETLKDVRSLVEVELTRSSQVILLERSELDHIMEEQRVVLAGWTEESQGLALGRLQGADLVGLCLEDRLPAQGDPRLLPSGLRVSLFEVQTSFKLVDESITFPTKEDLSLEEFAREIAGRLRLGLRKYPAVKSGVVKVGIGTVQRGTWEPETLLSSDLLGEWFSRLLVRSPGVVVLERRHLGMSLAERLFQPELEPPAGCDVVVEAAVARLPDEQTELRITLRTVATAELVTLPAWTGSELVSRVLIDQAASILAAIQAAPGRPTTPEALAEEARRMFDQAYWAAKTDQELKACELAQAVLVIEPGHHNAQLLRTRMLPEVNAERFKAWERLTAAERQLTLEAQAWCLRDYYSRRCAFVQTNRNMWSGWIRFGDLEDGYELGWLRVPLAHGKPELEKLAAELAIGFADFYQAEVERRQEPTLLFQLHSEDFASVLRETMGRVSEPRRFFELARRLYLLEAGRYPWRNGMALQRPGVTYQAMHLAEAVRQFRFRGRDGFWIELQEFHDWLRAQPEALGPFLADWLVYDCWRDVPSRAFDDAGRPKPTTGMSTSWHDKLVFASESGLSRADCVRRLTARVPAILTQAGGRKIENLKAMLRGMRFLEEAETSELLEIWARARQDERVCPNALAWRLAGVLEQRERWEALDRVTSEALPLLEPGAPEGRELMPARDRARARLGRESAGEVLWSKARQILPLTTLRHPPVDWIVTADHLFWIDTAGGLHQLELATGTLTAHPILSTQSTNTPHRTWDISGWVPIAHRLALCRRRLFACHPGDGLLELDLASGHQRLVDARQGLPANRVLMLVTVDDRLVCVGVRGFSEDLNVSPPKVLFTFDPDSGRSQPIAGSGTEAPGFPNRNVRHLEFVDLSPDPVRDGLWAIMLVNNRSKLFWYSASENRWHELLDQFFDWHLGHEDRLLEPHPAGVLVGRHLYNASKAQLRPVAEVVGAQEQEGADGLGLIGPHVVYWNGAMWGVTGEQRLARLGGPQPFAVAVRLQSLEEVIVRLIPTPVSLLVVTRQSTPEAFSIWQLHP